LAVEAVVIRSFQMQLDGHRCRACSNLTTARRRAGEEWPACMRRWVLGQRPAGLLCIVTSHLMSASMTSGDPVDAAVQPVRSRRSPRASRR